MLLTKKYLKSYLEGHFITVPKYLEERLLATLGHPIVVHGHICEFTEQDIAEQIRKALVSCFYDNPKSTF